MSRKRLRRVGGKQLRVADRSSMKADGVYGMDHHAIIEADLRD
jgi:ribosomal protein L32